jgi:hypothetical protein
MSRPIPHRTVKDINGPGNPAVLNKSDASKENKSSAEINFQKKSNSITYTRSSKFNFEKIGQKLNNFKKGLAAARSSLQKFFSFKNKSSSVGDSGSGLSSIKKSDGTQSQRGISRGLNASGSKSEPKTLPKTIPVFEELRNNPATEAGLTALCKLDDQDDLFCSKLSQKLQEINGDATTFNAETVRFIDFIHDQINGNPTTTPYYVEKAVSFAHRWENLCANPDAKSKLSNELNDEIFRAISAAATALVNFDKSQ